MIVVRRLEAEVGLLLSCLLLAQINKINLRTQSLLRYFIVLFFGFAAEADDFVEVALLEIFLPHLCVHILVEYLVGLLLVRGASLEAAAATREQDEQRKLLERVLTHVVGSRQRYLMLEQEAALATIHVLIFIVALIIYIDSVHL